jgi:hypothetical protein
MRYILLPVVLYGCETWFLILKEEHRLRVFENRVLRKIFVPKRDEVTGGWRKLHNEKLHNLYSSPNIIDLCRACSTNMGNINAYRILVGKSEETPKKGKT